MGVKYITTGEYRTMCVCVCVYVHITIENYAENNAQVKLV